MFVAASVFRSALLIAGVAGSVGVVAAEPTEVLLRHRLTADQTLRYRVTHVAKTNTRMNGSEEIANVHTVSTRAWRVTNANAQEMTFDHVVETVAMTQQNGDADEIRWDSATGEKPPAVFSVVASQIGSPLATVTINPQGQEIRREDHGGTKASLGMGKLTLAFPETPVSIGGAWSVPTEIQARLESGEAKTIKIRQVYTLEKISAGVATLAIKSETLTPINDESVSAQVVQQLSNGSLRFDVDNGYLLSKELVWDETVVGFQGANSMMEYRARMNEELIRDGDVQSASKPARGSSADAKTR